MVDFENNEDQGESIYQMIKSVQGLDQASKAEGKLGQDLVDDILGKLGL